MLKDVDQDKFIHYQIPEINGLLKMDVFNIMPMHKKPQPDY